jgi:hypothetical protein
MVVHDVGYTINTKKMIDKVMPTWIYPSRLELEELQLKLSRYDDVQYYLDAKQKNKSRCYPHVLTGDNKFVNNQKRIIRNRVSIT